MKRSILILCLATATFTVVKAQDSTLTSKKGEKYLPQTEDIGIETSLSPVFQYLNDVRSGTFERKGNITNDYTIRLKYFRALNHAARFNLRVKSDKQVFQNDLGDDKIDRLELVDRLLVIGGGYEIRRGHTRLQGYYGGDLNFGIGRSNRSTYTYGYGLKQSNNGRAYSVWDANNEVSLDTISNGSSRVLSDEGDAIRFVELRPFIGAEYYFLPKMCIGVELAIQARFGFEGTREIETEIYNQDSEVSEVASNYNARLIDSESLNGKLFLRFHF